MRHLLLLLAYLGLVLGQATQPKAVPYDHVVDNCANKPMCRMFCDFGFLKGKDGCPVCKCAENPCKSHSCPPREICRPTPVHCVVPPCLTRAYEPSCFPVDRVDVDSGIRRCPMVKCKACDFGYERNALGCQTCKCKGNPCDAVRCGFGKVCVTRSVQCFAAPCDKQVSCEKIKTDVHVCPEVLCAAPCKHGYVVSEFGCQTCTCKKPNACATIFCKPGTKCIVDPVTQDGLCKAEPLCRKHQVLSKQREMQVGHRTMASPFLLHGEPMMMQRDLLMPNTSYVPACQRDGAYRPQQCDKRHCWCVDDRGYELNHTRKPLHEKAHHCEPHRCAGMDVKFHLQHTMNNLNEHLPQFRSHLYQHISKWLLVERKSIINLQVNNENVHIVIVQFTVVPDGVTDLPSAGYHLQFQLIEQHIQLHYRGVSFKPVPRTLSVHHHYQPLAHPRIAVCFGARLRGHMHTMVAVGCGLILILTITLIVAVVARKRRLQIRRGLYAKNISSVEPPYRIMTDETDGEEKKVPLA